MSNLYLRFNALGKSIISGSPFDSAKVFYNKGLKNKVFSFFLIPYFYLNKLLGLGYKDYILFDEFTINDLCSYISSEFGDEYTLQTALWAGDIERKRCYCWLINADGEGLFVKVGAGEPNKQAFLTESIMSHAFSRALQSAGVKIVSSDNHSIRKVNLSISEVYNVRNSMIGYLEWPIVESYFKSIRSNYRTTKLFNKDILSFYQPLSEMFGEKYIEYLFNSIGNSFSVTLSHGDLGSENVFYSHDNDQLVLIDFERAAYDAPFLTDPVAVFLDSRNPTFLNNLDLFWLHFDSENNLDLILALSNLSLNNFPPAIHLLKNKFL